MTQPPRQVRGRLSRSAEFDRVYRHGRSAQDRLLVVYRFDRPDDVPAPNGERLGITVSKKVGGAVQRNRLKRQLRALLETSDQLVAGCDYVAIARPGLAELADRDPSELAQIVTRLLEKLAKATTR